MKLFATEKGWTRPETRKSTPASRRTFRRLEKLAAIAVIVMVIVVLCL
uniref:Uncharacterized protein n=1 Tax=Marseillevirus LCMAC103 TaxID=2506604 RepID=A0A481YVZ9_9VIRU|nr:MAG: hypothetical protein LCMAC103_00050 [Marseillevirus LCMAC103]